VGFIFNIDIPSQFVLTLPDLRARIKEMQIIGDNINVQIESNSYRDGELCVKFYCARGVEKRQPSPDIQVFNGKANFRARFEPDSIDSILMDINNDQMIDRKSLESWEPRQQGIIVNTPESYIADLIAKGESRTVEFKSNLRPPEEFLKTVVSFANTDGGTIIVGVSDQGDIRGFFENENDSNKTVRGSIANLCEPVIEPKIEWINMRSVPLMIVRVPEGTDKPYILRDRSIYVRKGEGDYAIDRNTLDAIYDMKHGRQFRGYITQE
jgi:hypothetical protein